MLELPLEGVSMSPLVPPGARLLCSTARRPRRGDLVLYQRAGVLLAHRLVGRAAPRCSGLLLLRGDSSPRLDPPLPAALCLGVVERILRSDRSLSCTGPAARAAFLLLAATGRWGAAPPGRPLTGYSLLTWRLRRLLCCLISALLWSLAAQPDPPRR